MKIKTSEVRKVMAYSLWFMLSGLLGASAFAAPALRVGSASQAAGAAVDVPITFDPGKASVASIQFDLSVPPGLSTGTVTAGSILTSAGKSVATRLRGSTWTFIIFGMNQNTIARGTLLTVQFMIPSGTAPGRFGLRVSQVVFSDINGKAVAPGAATNGAVIVPGGSHT